jgi:hypothetical protein
MSIPNDVLPSKDVLAKYYDELLSGTTDAAQANQALSTTKKNAEKEHNISWHWLKQAKRLNKMSETDRAGEVRNMLHTFEALGVFDQNDLIDPIDMGKLMKQVRGSNYEQMPDSDQADLDQASREQEERDNAAPAAGETEDA